MDSFVDNDDGKFLAHINHSGSSASSEFFSPISLGFFQASHQTTPKALVPLHDTSWIGARLSPIRSFDKETAASASSDDDDGDDGAQNRDRAQDFRIATRQKSGRLSVGERTTHRSSGGMFANERSRLIRNHHSPIEDFAAPSVFRNGKTTNIKTAAPLVPEHRKRRRRPCFAVLLPAGPVRLIGTTVCTVSALQLLAMIFATARTSRRITLAHGPWRIGPDTTTLEHFGAIQTSAVMEEAEYWRLLTALCMSTTVGELVVVAVAWSWLSWSVQHQQPSGLFPLIAVFVSSAVTGQLWMLAWQSSLEHGTTTASGCVSWGTCGVLCAIGIVQPQCRLPCFLWATGFSVLAWLAQPCNSILGTLAGAYFGWAIGAAGWLPEHLSSGRGSSLPSVLVVSTQEQKWQWKSGTVAIFMWVAPVLWIAFSY
jgi:hypothetical protein